MRKDIAWSQSNWRGCIHPLPIYHERWKIQDTGWRSANQLHPSMEWEKVAGCWGGSAGNSV